MLSTPAVSKTADIFDNSPLASSFSLTAGAPGVGGTEGGRGDLIASSIDATFFSGLPTFCIAMSKEDLLSSLLLPIFFIEFLSPRICIASKSEDCHMAP